MTVYINDTSDYHRKGLETLGWELTVCNALEPHNSPCRKILVKPAAYGFLLGDMLFSEIRPASVRRILEIGGGYGYLTRDLLSLLPHASAVMLDISPYLLEKQRETLQGLRAEFMLCDFFESDDDFFRDFDLAVFNENIGDFPCICGLTAEELKAGGAGEEASEFIDRYSLEIPEGVFNLNLGALKAVERVCRAGVPAAWFSEHSCESKAPDHFSSFIDTGSGGYPESIRLKDHYEYTIKFSHLEQTALKLGYRVKRGTYLDFIQPDNSPLLNFILSSGSSKDEHEIIRQFVEDLCKYEYILCLRD